MIQLTQKILRELVLFLHRKQVIHGYFLLYHVVVAIMGNTVRCYHNKVEGAFVLRTITVCINEGCFNLRNVLYQKFSRAPIKFPLGKSAENIAKIYL